MTHPNPQPRRNPWPIVITAYFAVFISFLVGFIIFATRQHVDLVRSDYYEEELRFQQQLDRVKRTQLSGQSAAIQYDSRHECITLDLPGAGGPANGSIHLYRPSDAKLDRDLPLSVDAQGRQSLDARALQTGLWRVRVQWTRQGQEYYSDQAIVIPTHS
jgi:nitrogen fixation protein FixH